MSPTRNVFALPIVLWLAACEESVERPPAIPPPPPPIPAGAQPPGEPPPPAATDQAIGVEAPPAAPPSAPPSTTVAPTSGGKGPLPDLPSQAPQLAPAGDPPPPAAQWTTEYPGGRWVYADEYGWMWIDNEPGSVVVEGVPYVYLYTPRDGWAWYVSPWGFGPYYYGVWVRHPWRPVGWRYAWVARPSVVVHIGGVYHGHGHAGHRGGRGR